MADGFSPREVKDISEATKLAESGNGSRLRDLVYNDKDFAHHTKIINEMLNLNKTHLHDVEIHPHDSTTPPHVAQLKLGESHKTVDGQNLIMRSVYSDDTAVYREIYNASKKTYLDTGSCPRPSGIIPPYIRIEQ